MREALQISEKPVRAAKDTGHISLRRRRLFVEPIGPGLVDRATALLWPWSVRSYPGIGRLRAWLLDVPVTTAAKYREWLPRMRAVVLADRLRAKRDEIDALIAELEAYAAAGGMRRETQKLTRKIVSPPVE
jgi:hypothetical protein